MANQIRVEAHHQVPGQCGQCGLNYETTALGSPVAGEATHDSLCVASQDETPGAFVAWEYRCPNCGWSQSPIHKRGVL
jgi:rubredoxin